VRLRRDAAKRAIVLRVGGIRRFCQITTFETTVRRRTPYSDGRGYIVRPQFPTWPPSRWRPLIKVDMLAPQGACVKVGPRHLTGYGPSRRPATRSRPVPSFAALRATPALRSSAASAGAEESEGEEGRAYEAATGGAAASADCVISHSRLRGFTRRRRCASGLTPAIQALSRFLAFPMRRHEVCSWSLGRSVVILIFQ
jgi:hypothetical protein